MCKDPGVEGIVRDSRTLKEPAQRRQQGGERQSVRSGATSRGGQKGLAFLSTARKVGQEARAGAELGRGLPLPVWEDSREGAIF